MTNNWKNAASGNWNASSNWSANETPQPGDDILIAATGANYTSTINASYSIDSLEIDYTGANVYQDVDDALAVTKSITLFAGALDLNSANNINTSDAPSGGVSVSGGALEIGNAAALGSAADSTLWLIGGSLIGTIDETIDNNIIAGASGSSSSVDIAAVAGATLTLGGEFTIAGEPVTLNFGTSDDAGTVILAPSEVTRDGSAKLVVADGVVKLGTAPFPGFGSPLTIDAGASFDVNGNDVFLPELAGAGSLVDGGVAATVFLSKGDFTGVISGRLNLEVISGDSATDEVTLAGSDTFTGTTDIYAGTLVVANSAALSTGAVAMATGAGLSADTSAGAMIIANPIDVAATPGAFATLADANSSNLVTFTGVISGAGEVAISSSGSGGTVDLDGASTYSGGTLIEAESNLELGASASAGSGAIIFGGLGASLEIAAGGSVGNVISGFAAYDSITFDGVAYADDDTVGVTAAGAGEQRVTVESAMDTPVASFTVAGDYAARQFALTSSGSSLEVDYAPIMTLNVSSELPDDTTQTLSGTIDRADANALLALVAAGGGHETTVLTNADGAGDWTATVTVPSSEKEVIFVATTELGGGLGSSNYAVLGAVGGLDIPFSNLSGDAASLYNTNNDWDAVTGSEGIVYLTNAQTNVTGGGDTIDFAGGTDSVSLYATHGDWDFINGSGGTIYATSSQTSVVGGGDAIHLLGNSGDAANLAGTSGDWDSVSGSNVQLGLYGARASLTGGGDGISFAGGSGNAVSLYATDNNWDNVVGSSGTVYLTSSRTSVTGDLDTIDFASGTGNAASLYGTGGVWDTVNGSSGAVYLTSAQASVVGGGDAINLAGTGDIASLAATGTTGDVVTGAGALDLYDATVKVDGSGDTLNFFDSDIVNLVSGGGALVFAHGIGGQDAIKGFGSTDTIQFSKSDFASWQALRPHLAQAGANTTITLDASNVVTLLGVAESSLTASEFKFV